jgi:hypothetical protein
MGIIKIIKAEYSQNDVWKDVTDIFKEYYRNNRKKGYNN